MKPFEGSTACSTSALEPESQGALTSTLGLIVYEMPAAADAVTAGAARATSALARLAAPFKIGRRTGFTGRLLPSRAAFACRCVPLSGPIFLPRPQRVNAHTPRYSRASDLVTAIPEEAGRIKLDLSWGFEVSAGCGLASRGGR